MMEVNN